MLIGIDFGTTNSCMAVLENGEPTVIPNAEGGRTTPSVVWLTPDGWFGVGAEALQTPDQVTAVASIKRLLGRMKEELSPNEPPVPYTVVGGASGEARIALDAEEYGTAEVTAMILAKLKADAEAYLGEPVDGAVVAVPAYFDDDQRQAIMDAGTIAGLPIERLINEPMAACLDYGLDQEAEQTILIADVGGGGFSACVIELGDGIFEVKSAIGDNGVGGEAWDGAIVSWFHDEAGEDHALDPVRDAPTLARRSALAEQAKIDLSTASQVRIRLPRLGPDAEPLDLLLTRAMLDELTAPLVSRIASLVRQVLEDARFRGTTTIDRLVVVGGMGRVPAIRRRLSDLTGLVPVDAPGGSEAVALGAAIQAAVMEGNIRDALVLDVSPHTLGVTSDGLTTKVIERNATIPTRKSVVFSTADDDQPQIEVRVVQGERAVAAENKSLGCFHVSGFRPAARGVPQIEVSFDLDVNGMVNLSARDLGTGERQAISSSRVGLDEDELTQLTAAIKGRHVRSSVKAAGYVGGYRPPAGSTSERPPRTPQGRDHPMRPIRVFVSYSHKDKEFLGSLEETLAILQSQGLLEAWHDGLIEPGKDWRSEIASNLATADLILMLVSRPFLASPFCREEEMRVALDRHAAGDARVIPVLIRPSDWEHTKLKALQALPSGGVPVSKWADQDDAWQHVTDALRQVLKDLQA